MMPKMNGIDVLKKLRENGFKTPITVIATSLKVLEMENGKQKWIDKAIAQTKS